MTATITAIATHVVRRSRKARRKQQVSNRMSRRLFLQHCTAVVLGLVASAITCVSLAHIAGGTEHLTHGAIPHWQAWGVAIGLDVNYVGMEMAGLVAALQHVRDKLHRLTRFGIPAVMGFSAAMNALEFAAGATSLAELAAGIAMGIILPALVWLTFRVAAILADV